MTLFHLILLAIVQGVTEFLPISSSGHLILLPALTGMADQGQALDVAVHVGSLGAILLYFRRDVLIAALGGIDLLRGRFDTPGAFLMICLIIATIPVVIAGLIMKLTGLDGLLRSTAVIGWMMIIFGIVLWWSDRVGKPQKRADGWTVRDAVILGLWQAVALIPGTSRSGIVITGARFLNYDRESAAKLSMLMSIPTIIASGTLLGLEVASDANAEVAREGAIAAVFALIAALVSLKLMFRLLKSVNFTPYVIYRVIFGAILLWVAYT